MAVKLSLSRASALAGAVVLSACASSGKELTADGRRADYKNEIGVFTDPSASSDMDPIAAASFWGSRYNQNPRDVNAAVAYSAALRKIRSNEEAVKVITQAANANPDHHGANLEAGRALVEAGRAFEAVRFLEKAEQLNPQDWRTLSAFGVALDQINEHQLARAKYDVALSFAPGSPMILNNKGLSFALDGDLDAAKMTLRGAAAARGADARVRQNLALVLALKGEMSEAERLARSDLPPQVADQNIDYFRALVNQPAYWQEFAADEVETPAFDEKPAPKKAAAKKQEPAPMLKEPTTPATPAAAKAEPAPAAAKAATPATPASATPAEAPTPLLKGSE
jgi:Flp pilus assembly protein TadD